MINESKRRKKMQRGKEKLEPKKMKRETKSAQKPPPFCLFVCLFVIFFYVWFS